MVTLASELENLGSWGRGCGLWEKNKGEVGFASLLDIDALDDLSILDLPFRRLNGDLTAFDVEISGNCFLFLFLENVMPFKTTPNTG